MADALADSVRNIIHAEVVRDEDTQLIKGPFVGVNEGRNFIVTFKKGLGDGHHGLFGHGGDSKCDSIGISPLVHRDPGGRLQAQKGPVRPIFRDSGHFLRGQPLHIDNQAFRGH